MVYCEIKACITPKSILAAYQDQLNQRIMASFRLEGPQDISSPTSCSKQVRPGCSGLYLLGLRDFQGWRSKGLQDVATACTACNRLCREPVLYLALIVGHILVFLHSAIPSAFLATSFCYSFCFLLLSFVIPSPFLCFPPSVPYSYLFCLLL